MPAPVPINEKLPYKNPDKKTINTASLKSRSSPADREIKNNKFNCKKPTFKNGKKAQSRKNDKKANTKKIFFIMVV